MILTKTEFTLSLQLVKSATSIGANFEEASKMNYLLRLLRETNYFIESIHIY